MKTMLIKLFQGEEIITGFDSMVIDPAQTIKSITRQLIKTAEHQNLVKIDQELRKATDDGNKFQISAKTEEYREALIAYKIKKRMLFGENLAYFTPKDGEFSISKNKLKELKKKMKELETGERLKKDGTVYKVKDPKTEKKNE